MKVKKKIESFERHGVRTSLPSTAIASSGRLWAFVVKNEVVAPAPAAAATAWDNLTLRLAKITFPGNFEEDDNC